MAVTKLWNGNNGCISCTMHDTCVYNHIRACQYTAYCALWNKSKTIKGCLIMKFRRNIFGSLQGPNILMSFDHAASYMHTLNGKKFLRTRRKREFWFAKITSLSEEDEVFTLITTPISRFQHFFCGSFVTLYVQN